MSNTKKPSPIHQTNKSQKLSKPASAKKPPKQKKMSSKEKAWLSDMNQIEWLPFDPYSD